jgi:hypothetical protein
MRPADLPAVQVALDRQNRRDGTSFALPEIWDREGNRLPRIALALVAADVKTDRAITGWVWERTLEMCGYGVSRRATFESVEQADAVFWALREKGYTDLHIQVPKKHAAALEAAMTEKMGMLRDDDELAHFYRLLDPEENRLLHEFMNLRKRGIHEPEPTDAGL